MTWKETMIRKYGSEEAFRKAMSERGKKGGQTKVPKGMSMHPATRRKELGRLAAKVRWGK